MENNEKYSIENYLCKIENKDKSCSGISIKIKNKKTEKYFYYLFIKEYIITEEEIDSNRNIFIYYNNEKEKSKIKLNKNKRIIKYYQSENLTIIEILPEKDNINENYFFELNELNCNLLIDKLLLSRNNENKNLKDDNFINEIINSLKKNLYYDEKEFGNEKYKGEFSKNGKKEGYGEYIYENGENYKGEWYNDKRHGKGELYNKNKKLIHKQWPNPLPIF